MSNDIGGVWRTVGGRRIFIKDGEELSSAMKRSGKFKNLKNDKEGFKPRAKGSKTFEEHGIEFSSNETKEALSDYLRDKYGTDDIDVITTGSERTPESIKKELAKTGKEARDNLKELKLDKYSDGTYNIDTKKAEDFTKGYQATFQQLNDKYSDEEFGALVEKYKKVGNGNVYAGKFGGSPEVSFYFEKEEDAIEICKKFNQVSYWDWEKGDEIKNKYYKKGAGNDYE